MTSGVFTTRQGRSQYNSRGLNKREHEVGVGVEVGPGNRERGINMIKIHCMEPLGTQGAHRPGKQVG